MLEYASTSPPARLPWLVDEAGAHVDYRKHRLFPSAKNHLTWRPCEAGGSRALVVIGDSYADDVDMGFETWPSQLARALPATLVNTARGGSRTPAALEQLARADRRLPTEQFPVGERLLVVHTGGNDLLLALLLPPLTLLLWLDVLALSGASAGLRPPSRRGTSTTRPRRVRDMCIGLWSPPARPAHLSFIGLVSRRSAQELRRLLRAAESRGYRLVLVSRLPLSPCIPLARALVTLLTFGLAPTAHVTATLRSCFRLFGAALDEALAGFAAEAPAVRLLVLDEAALLDDLSAAEGADACGLLWVPRLVAQRMRKNAALWRSGGEQGAEAQGSGGAAAPHPSGCASRALSFWHDAHHPSHATHAKIASHALSLIQTVWSSGKC